MSASIFMDHVDHVMVNRYVKNGVDDGSWVIGHRGGAGLVNWGSCSV